MSVEKGNIRQRSCVSCAVFGVGAPLAVRPTVDVHIADLNSCRRKACSCADCRLQIAPSFPTLHSAIAAGSTLPDPNSGLSD